MFDVKNMLETLRSLGSDTARIEVKNGAGGYPQSALSSLSALANLPGGGVLIIGLDEASGFKPVNLQDIPAYMQALGGQARALQPPAQIDISQVDVEGKPIIVAEVKECDPSAKPCRIASSGLAYVRSHDGDYEISSLEEQAFLRLRSAPDADRHVVPDTSPHDLDSNLVRLWRETVRRRDPDGLGRFNDEEMLIRSGAVARDGSLTRAGLLALGSYPQQYFPRLGVHVADMRGMKPNERARNIQTFTGAIPVMLSATLSWLTSNLTVRTVESTEGSVRDEPEYPLIALRELVANALVHRDLDTWSEGMAVEIRLRPNRLEITNPGGLYGLTSDRLGSVEVTSARNQWLLSLCENVSDTKGARVVEALATGLTTVARELVRAELPPARYFDTGLMFTAVLTDPVFSVIIDTSTASSLLPKNGTNIRTVFDWVVSRPGQSVEEIANASRLSENAVRTALTSLRSSKWNLVTTSGGRGKYTTYFPIPK